MPPIFCQIGLDWLSVYEIPKGLSYVARVL